MESYTRMEFKITYFLEEVIKVGESKRIAKDAVNFKSLKSIASRMQVQGRGKWTISGKGDTIHVFRIK